MQIRKLIVFFSPCMLLKSQTNAIKYVFSFIPNQSNSEFGSSMLFTIVFLPLINGKSVAHLFQTIIRLSLLNNFNNHLLIITLSRIGNPVNHLSELLHCSPSNTIGQQRQDNNLVSRGSKKRVAIDNIKGLLSSRCVFIYLARAD